MSSPSFYFKAFLAGRRRRSNQKYRLFRRRPPAGCPWIRWSLRKCHRLRLLQSWASAGMHSRVPDLGCLGSGLIVTLEVLPFGLLALFLRAGWLRWVLLLVFEVLQPFVKHVDRLVHAPDFGVESGVALVAPQLGDLYDFLAKF